MKQKPTSERVYRELTRKEWRQVGIARSEIDAAKDEILAEGRRQKQAYQKTIAEEQAGRAENIEAARPIAEMLKKKRVAIAAFVAELRAARLETGISLSEMESRTGIHKSALSRLENSPTPNPTVGTLQRYAAALGKQLHLSLDHQGWS